MKRILLLTVAWVLLPSSPLFAQAKENDLLRTSSTFKKAFKDVVAKSSQSVVRVLCNGKDTALGMVVGPDGWILTKANDLKGKITCRLRDGQEFEATQVGKQEPHDLALLKIDARGLIPVEFKESKKVAVGDWAASVGTTDEPVAIGVIGVGTRNVPAPKIKLPTVDVIKSGYLGVQLEPGEGGVKVVQVMPDTAAAKAGLKANDIILRLNGTEYFEPDAFIQEMAKHKPGDVITLKYRRTEEEKEIKVTLGKRPPNSNRGDIQDQMGSQLSSRRFGYPTVLQHDAVLKPTDCGSPLVDLEGKVIGINVSRAGRTETWAVPSEVVQSLLVDLMSGKLAPKEAHADKQLIKLDKLSELRSAVEAAEAQLAQAEKRLAELKKALAKAKAEEGANPKNNTELVQASDQPAQIVDRLLTLMNQRLDLMTEVAKAKWNAKTPIADGDREREQLASLVQQGRALGMKNETVETFFRAQFAASRRLQELHHQAWAKMGQPSFPQTKNLPELRGTIDHVNVDLLNTLAKIQAVLGQQGVQDRFRARSAQLLTGIREEVRNRALEPLLQHP